MGFQIDVTTQDGVTHTGAYFKVSDVRIDHTDKHCRFQLQVWTNKAARDAGNAQIRGPKSGAVRIPQAFTARNGVRPPLGGDPVDQFDDNFALTLQDPAGTNLIDLCYAYAKAEIIAAGVASEDITDVDPDA